MTHIWTCYTPAIASLAELTLPYLREYCARHGYKLHVEVLEEHSSFGNVTFDKILKVLEFYQRLKRCDLWVFDIDILITNMAIPLPDKFNVPILMTKDINGLNSGVFRLRSVGWADEVAPLWLRTILALRESFKTEQFVMQALQPAFDRYTHYAEHPAFNSIDFVAYPEYGDRHVTHEQGCWEHGDLVLHFPGKSNQERLDLFPRYFDKVIR